MTDHQQGGAFQYLRRTVREYITHWAVAGVVVTTTGFAPDHWVAHLMEGIPAGLRHVFPSGIDYRLLVVCVGISVIALDIFFRNRHQSRIESSEATSGVMYFQSDGGSLPAAGAAIDQRPVAVDQPNAPDGLSIAVLPFANLNNDPEQTYFAEGLTASLTTDLSRISGLFVIASTTTASFGGREIDIRQIGRDLGVRYILQGSVQKGGDKVRINAQLVDAGTGAQLWSDRFDGDATELFALQDQITGRIANSIGRQFIVMAARNAERRNTNPRAADLLVRGIALADKPQSVENLLEQETLFRGALALDPNNSNAWARLGRSILLQLLSGFGSALMPEQKDEKLREGRKAVEKALALDPYSAHAHLAEANLYRALGKNAEAARANEAAIALDRNLAHAHGNLGIALIHLGEPEKAILCIEQAMRLDPRGSSIANQQLNMGRALFLQRHTDLAIDWLLKARTSNPKLPRPYACLAAAYAMKGDVAAARLALESLLHVAPNFKISDAFDQPRPFSPEAYCKLYDEVFLPAARRAGIPE